MEKYPASLRKTAQLYTQKPSVFMKAEHLALERLYRQSPAKLRAMGLSKKEVKARLDRAQQKMQAEEEKIQAAKKPIKKPHIPIPESKPRLKAAASTVTEQPKKPKKVDMITELFEVAKMEYKTHQFEATERHLRELLAVITKKAQEEHPTDAPLTKAPFIPSGTHIISEKEIEKKAISRPGSALPPKKESSSLQPKTASRPTTARSNRPSSARPASAKPKPMKSPAFSTYDDDDFEVVEELEFTSAKDRPMTARPNRTSSFPKTDDFSDVESDYEKIDGDKSFNASTIESNDILGSASQPLVAEQVIGLSETNSITEDATSASIKSQEFKPDTSEKNFNDERKDSLTLSVIPTDIAPEFSDIPLVPVDDLSLKDDTQVIVAEKASGPNKSVDSVTSESERNPYEEFTSTPQNTAIDQSQYEEFTSTPPNTTIEHSKEQLSDRGKQETKSQVPSPPSDRTCNSFNAPRKPLARTQSYISHNFKHKEQANSQKKQNKSANNSMDKLDLKNKPIVSPKKAKQSPHQSNQKVSTGKAQTPANASTPREAAAKVFVSQLLRDTAQELQHESRSSQEENQPSATTEKSLDNIIDQSQIKKASPKAQSSAQKPRGRAQSEFGAKIPQNKGAKSSKSAHNSREILDRSPVAPKTENGTRQAECTNDSTTSNGQKNNESPTAHDLPRESNESLRSALKSPMTSQHSLHSPKSVQWQDQSELSTQKQEPALPKKASEEIGDHLVLQ